MLVGWFPKENRETLEMLIKKHEIKTVIEVGCFVGLSTVFFAERCERVIAIDTFDALIRESYLGEKHKEAAQDQLKTFKENTKDFNNILALKMTSEEASKLPIEADLIYIDAAHDYENVKKDMGLWLPKANKVLCGDDYTDRWPGVKKAVNESGLNINKNQRVWYMTK